MFTHSELMVCQDCLLAIANDDFTGLDSQPETADERMADIQAGIERLGEHLVCCSDEETDLELSSSPCECCGDRLAGSRHACAVLCQHPECEPELDDFERAYIACALWSSTDNSDDSGGEPLDANYNLDDLDPKCRADMRRDCRNFREQAKGLLEESELSDEQSGDDFWLTRNGHGAGFWDRGLGEVGEKLSQLCKPYGSVDLYIGDDGKVYS